MVDPKPFRPKAFPPPQFPPARPPLFSRTPPAIFPPIMGLFGLGLALRRAADAALLPVAVGDLVLGAVSLLWLFAVAAYLAKVVRRPAVVVEDLRVLPGRAGLAAMVLSLLLLAAALVPHAPGAARVLLIAGLAIHAGLALLNIRLLLSAPAGQREVTPVWHLTYVGFIIGGLAAVPLGMEALAKALLWGTIPVAALIWGISLAQLFRRIPPAPLRPLLAIHLAPASLFATVAALLWDFSTAVAFGVLAGLILLALLAAARWITQAGFSPLWGAFTFPLAAFASSLFTLGFDVTATIVLIGAVGLIPFVAFRVLQSWARGDLAAKTNAAQA